MTGRLPGRLRGRLCGTKPFALLDRYVAVRELIRRFDSETFSRGLEDWAWQLEGKQLEPIAASMFGDVFLQGPDAAWFLDMMEGDLSPEWPDVQALQADLNTLDGQDHYLLGGIVAGASERGIVAGPGQVLMFSVLPVLGGAISPDNVQAMDYVVASSICGQIRRQLRSVPAGAEVTRLTVGGETP